MAFSDTVTGSIVDAIVPQQFVCGRCNDLVDRVYPTNCSERPELLLGQPIGMYHCPDCGAMVLAGLEHPLLCQLCLDRKHPAFYEV